MNKIALIHCGCHKTGSTVFQSLLRKNDKKLNYYVPKTLGLILSNKSCAISLADNSRRKT